MDKLIPKCPKCDGQVLPDGGERKCLQCGYVPEGIRGKAEFYKHNRDIFLPVLQATTPVEAAKLTGIPKGSIRGLRKLWAETPAPAAVPIPPAKATGKVPELPAFSDSWAPSVQSKWLDIYLAIKANKL